MDVIECVINMYSKSYQAKLIITISSAVRLT